MRTKQIYFTPEEVLSDLNEKYSEKNILGLLESTRKPRSKADREKIFGIIFVSGLRSITGQDYRLTLPEIDEDTDIEIINVTEYEKNQLLSQKDRIPDHFNIQNVQITSYNFKEQLGGSLKFWDVISNHIYGKKGRGNADYTGCILVIHLRANIQGLTEEILNQIRISIRTIDNITFKEIWITGVTSKSSSKGVITELLQNNYPFMEFQIPS